MQKHRNNGVRNVLDIVWELGLKHLNLSWVQQFFMLKLVLSLGFTNLASYNCFLVNEVGESHMDNIFHLQLTFFFQVYVLFFCLHEMILMWLYVVFH
jgi:hypothetical protein